MGVLELTQTQAFRLSARRRRGVFGLEGCGSGPTHRHGAPRRAGERRVAGAVRHGCIMRDMSILGWGWGWAAATADLVGVPRARFGIGVVGVSVLEHKIVNGIAKNTSP